MSLQNRISELESGIINICKDNIYITGFTCEERLFDYYENQSKCWYSYGIYSNENYDIAYIIDNAVFIIMENNIEQKRHKFVPIWKETIRYKSENTKSSYANKTYTIRKCKYTEVYNYKDSDQSIIFETESQLNKFIALKYSNELNIGEQVSLI